MLGRHWLEYILNLSKMSIKVNTDEIAKLSIKPIDEIKDLDLSGKDIGHLEDLSTIKNLEKLNLSNNQLEDLKVIIVQPLNPSPTRVSAAVRTSNG